MTDEEALARNVYACCGHCYAPGGGQSTHPIANNHESPCPEGCND